jgi:hypothetical protein
MKEVRDDQRAYPSKPAGRKENLATFGVFYIVYRVVIKFWRLADT